MTAAPGAGSTSSTPPLDGVVIADLTDTIAGAMCTMLLADFGARVIRLTDARVEAGRTEPGFVGMDRGKERMLLTGADDPRLAQVLAVADVVVTASTSREVIAPDALERMLADRPEVVLLALPPYAETTPWAGDVESAGLLSATLGLGMRQYSTAGVPVDPVYPHILYGQGSWAAVCAVAALIERLGSGAGQRVTVGGAHGALISAYATFGHDPVQPPLDPPGPGGPNPFYTRYRCADGEWLFLGTLTSKFQWIALETLGLRHLVDDPRVDGVPDMLGTPANREWAKELFGQRFATRTAEEWRVTLRDAGCPVSLLLHREDWLDHPQIRAIGMRAEFDQPGVGPVVMPGVPLALSRTPARVAAASTDADDVPQPAPAADAPGRPTAGDGAAPTGPLAGVRVLDLGVVLAGPMAGNLLAELGADVVKIEPPTGDPFRNQGFLYNRGMRSVAVDLRDPRGHDVFLALAQRSDVVIDNFRSGVLERLGVDHAALAAVNPGITSLSVTGFGASGPLKNEPGFDPVLGAMSGMMFAQGGDADPVMITMAINDVTAAVMVTLGAVLSVYATRAHGEPGQSGATSLAATSALAQVAELTRWSGREAPRVGGDDHLGAGPLTRSYRVADGWVRVHGANGDERKLADVGLLASDGAGAASGELELALIGRTRAEALELFARAGVAAMPARTMAEAAEDEAVAAEQLVHDVPKSSGGIFVLPGRLARFSRTERNEVLAPPGLGEHTREVLLEAGLDDTEVVELLSEGVLVEGGAMRLSVMPGYR